MTSTGLSLSCQLLDLDLGRYQVVLNKEDADALGVHAQDRLYVRSDGEAVVAVLDTTKAVIQPGNVGVFPNVATTLDVAEGDQLELLPAKRPASVDHIRPKMAGNALEHDEIHELVEDMVSGALTDIELAAFVTSVEIHGMNLRETEKLTQSMVETGERIDFGEDVVYDKHSIGGVPGNKITLLIVPIVAAAGLKLPKTSSRAITGAAGTSDVVETFCDVHLSADEIRRITNEVGGVMAWGGAVNLAPADDIIIRVEHPLSLDPPSILLSSVMAKKQAVSADCVVIDIPMGLGSKVPDMGEAKEMARDFIALGDRLGMDVECAITYGGQPVGKKVGAALEANEAVRAMRDGIASESFTKKATAVAGILLEMGGAAPRGRGQAEARRLLDNGAAWEKFCEIVQAQGGPEPDIQEVGTHTWEIRSEEGGYVSAVDNRAIVKLARALGAPRVKGAGVELLKKRGDGVEEDEPLLRFYAESEHQLKIARQVAQGLTPIEVEGMLLERVPDVRQLEGSMHVSEPE